MRFCGDSDTSEESLRETAGGCEVAAASNIASTQCVAHPFAFVPTAGRDARREQARTPALRRTPYTVLMIKQLVASFVVFASMRCATDTTPGFEHLDECPNPIAESMSWDLVQGSVVDVTTARTFRLLEDSGEVLTVSLANVGEPADPEATDVLKRMINGKRISVMLNHSADRHAEVTGEVNDQEGRDIARKLLRAGAATFVAAPAYTLSDYSECLHRIAEREAKAEGLGVWRHR